MRPLHHAQNFVRGLGAGVHDLNRRAPGVAEHAKQLFGAFRAGYGNELRLLRVSFEDAAMRVVEVARLPFDGAGFQPFNAGKAFGGFPKVSFALNRG
jgi:hypothetical protein